MGKNNYGSFAITFLFLLSVTFFTRAQEVKVIKVTDKIKAFNLTGVSNCNIVAVSSDEGNILIDTEISPGTMDIIKEAVLNEFPGKKIIYVINTHAHTRHCGGNALFKDIPIIAHENITEDMQWWFDAMADEKMKANFSEYTDKIVAQCEDQIKNNRDSAEIESLNKLAGYWKNLKSEFINGFEIVVPSIRFSDKMTLKLPDLTLNLIYYGKGHSKSDILVHIPEEKVLISGAVINSPLPSAYPKGESKKDIEHWISVLKLLNDKINTIETVIPGHGSLINKEQVGLQYEYFSEMLDKIKSMKDQEISLEDAKQRLSLNNGFSNFTQLANLSDEKKEDHLKNIEVFWNNIKSASINED